MKTIILTSKDDHIATNELDRYLPKPLSKSKILCITTALRHSSDKEYIKKQEKILSQIDFTYPDYDIEGKSEQELRNVLSKIDVVYVVGGSAFYLLKTIQQIGFDKMLKEYLPKGLVYIGLSAGAYVACPSIVMKTWTRKSDRHGVSNLSAMNLVPFYLKCHYSPDIKDILLEKAKNLDLPLRVLNNNQALVIRGSDKRLIGKGEEIIFA